MFIMVIIFLPLCFPSLFPPWKVVAILSPPFGLVLPPSPRPVKVFCTNGKAQRRNPEEGGREGGGSWGRIDLETGRV